MQFTIYVLLGFAMAVIILHYLAPKSYHICRTIRIEKPAHEIFSFIRCLGNQDLWSPWAEKDPDMEKEFFGTDGEVGAIRTWKGNKEVGEGEQEITRIIEGELMESRVCFYKPFRSESDAYIRVQRLGENHSEITWGFSGKHNFPVHILMLFLNMDKTVGQDFEYGLRKLKLQLEK